MWQYIIFICLLIYFCFCMLGTPHFFYLMKWKKYVFSEDAFSSELALASVLNGV